MKRLIKWFKNLFSRYSVIETYYIKTEYAYLKCVQEFLKNREEVLNKSRCKYELILLKHLETNKEIIGKVKTKHSKYNIESKAVLILKNGLIYWRFL